MQPWQLVLIGVAGWMNRKQQQLIDYLLEENRVLREQLGKQRLSFSEAQKKRLALKAKAVGLRRLKEIASAATPQALMPLSPHSGVKLLSRLSPDHSRFLPAPPASSSYTTIANEGNLGLQCRQNKQVRIGWGALQPGATNAVRTSRRISRV